jgi:hypothetical protein
VLVPSWGDPSFIGGQPGSEGQTQETEGNGPQAGIENGAIVPGSSFAGGFDSGSFVGENRPDLPQYYRDLIIEYQDLIGGN